MMVSVSYWCLWCVLVLADSVHTWSNSLNMYWPEFLGGNRRGYEEFGARIVGGIDATILEAPYQVSVQEEGYHFCGGAVITAVHILTATHCTEEKDASVLEIRAGSTFKDYGGVLVKVQMIIEHPYFDTDSVDFDVSILKLAQPLNFTDFIKPIPLAEPWDEWPPGTFGLITGWGVTKEGLPSSAPRNLQAVYLQITNLADCVFVYGAEKLTDRMMCVWYQDGGRDSCQGDSGGPFQVNGVLVGIVSWGSGCARAGVPGIYTKVSTVRDFIDQALQY